MALLWVKMGLFASLPVAPSEGGKMFRAQPAQLPEMVGKPGSPKGCSLLTVPWVHGLKL